MADFAFRKLTTKEKALKINLDSSLYGSFGEIGAGQEVAANFFQAGGASGTIAFSTSAYDMKISDSMYGSCERYVCEERLLTMLDKEFSELNHKLDERAQDTNFFAFANTVEALNYHKTNQGHGWIGLKFQLSPNTPPNECIIHVKLYDNTNLLQQHALGVIGVNLIYACYYHHNDPEQLLQTLFDDLDRDRIEIDMFRLSGPDFEHVDNRLMSLKLVKNGMTEAAIFGPDSDVLQPSTALYKKNILVLRGRFRPVTHVNLDMLNSGLDAFKREHDVDENKIAVLFELTLKDLSTGNGNISEKDFLDRVDILCSLGHNVMISNYLKFYKLLEYLSPFSKGSKIGTILGIYNLETVFQEKYYENLRGGILEAFGKGLGTNIKFYVYPALHQGSNELYTSQSLKMEEKVKGLFTYLQDNNKIEDIQCKNTELLRITSDAVLEMIQSGNQEWQNMVPVEVSTVIKGNKLFNYNRVEENSSVGG
jgi:hypothetical protein